MPDQQQPLSPDQLAITPDKALTLVYRVPVELTDPGNEEQLRNWLLLARASGLYAITSGQMDAAVQGKSFSGYRIAFLHPMQVPASVADFFSESPVETSKGTVDIRWEATASVMQGHETEAAEEVIRRIMAEVKIAPDEALMLWVTDVGSYRKAGLLVLNATTKQQRPYAGPIPGELDEAIIAHKKLAYETSGRAWVSLLAMWAPVGEFQLSLRSDDVHEWTRPVPEAAWQEHRAQFPPRQGA